MKHSCMNLTAILLAAVIAWTALTAPMALAETKAIPKRVDIENRYKWKVEDIHADMTSWNADFDVAEKNLPRFEEYKGQLGESAANLLELLELKDSLDLIVSNLLVYAYLKLDEDNRDSEYQELTGRISALNSKMNEALSWVEPEVIEIGKEKLTSFIESEKGLKIYTFYLMDMIRTNEHILSPEEEAILALAGPVAGAPSRIFTMLTDADLTYGTILDEEGNEVELNRGRVYKFLESKDRRVRKDARQAYNNAYLKVANTLAASLEGSVKRDYFYMQAREYNSCLEMSLDNHNIPTSVFHSLIEAVNANLAPLHKWTSIRKRILGYDTLFVWDLSVPLVDVPEKEYSWEEGMEVVLNGLQPLGEDYHKEFESGLKSGWIDVYETQGKGSGAYSWGTYSSHPYILMNYNGTVDHVFTLAHEMGHAMHSVYTHRNEPYVSGDHSLFVAEVASTCNEAILMKYLLEQTANKKERMFLLNKYIEQIQGTFYTQVMFSEFEIAIHEKIEAGEALSVDYLRKTYRDIYQKYWGPELVIDENNDLGGMRISHFYRQYYVYQYATSYAAAQMLSQKILDGDKQALKRYMDFLSTGTSEYPVEILKTAGVDLTSPEPVQATIQLFSDLVDEMERLLDEN